MGILQDKDGTRETNLTTEELALALSQNTVLGKITSDVFPLIRRYGKERKGILKTPPYEYKYKFCLQGDDLHHPMAVAVWDKKIYVGDQFLSHIVVFDYQGNVLFKIGPKLRYPASAPEVPSSLADTKPFPQDALNQPPDETLEGPVGLVIDPKTGNIITAEHFACLLRLFDQEGICLKTLSPQESGLSYPFDVAMDAQDNVYVADSDHERIRIFTTDLNWIRDIDCSPSIPTGVRIDLLTNNIVVVCQEGNVSYFDQQGTLLKQFKKGDGPQNLNFKNAFRCDIDGQGNLLIPDQESGLLTSFDSEGKKIITVSQKGKEPHELMSPVTVVVDPDGNILVSDTANSRVSVWG